jgi:quinol monooxygenase YgiN
VTLQAQAQAYVEYLTETGVRDSRATPGNLGVYVLNRTEGEMVHFVFISLWESVQAIESFAGAEIEKARYYPADREFLTELESTVSHYEVCVQELPVG